MQIMTIHTMSLQSSNGKSRAGVYCAANFAMEQVVQHNEVDIFNAVRTVRRHRPHLVENMVSLLIHKIFCIFNKCHHHYFFPFIRLNINIVTIFYSTM